MRVKILEAECTGFGVYTGICPVEAIVLSA